MPQFLHLLSGRHNSNYFLRMLWRPQKITKGPCWGAWLAPSGEPEMTLDVRVVSSSPMPGVEISYKTRASHSGSRKESLKNVSAVIIKKVIYLQLFPSLALFSLGTSPRGSWGME